MNGYNQFNDAELERYDHLKMRISKKKPIYEQINNYLNFCANIRQMSRMTMHAKECALRYLIMESGCVDLRELTNEMYDKFVQTELERGVSTRTVNGRTAHIVAMIRYYREMDLMIPLRLPLVFKLKELPPRRTCYTKEQINRVLRRCNSDIAWLLIKIAFDTGMRISEITNLTVEQINGRRIHFIGKGTKEREVWLTKECADRLKEYCERRGIEEGRIWLNDWGYPTSSDTLRRIMKDAFKKCGYDDFYPHALRHSFGSDIQRQGADVMEIKEMMGHSNVATTQRYLHSLDGQLASLFNTYKR